MRRSDRSRRRGAAPFGSPPLVTLQDAKPNSIACDLNETIDEYDIELCQAAQDAHVVPSKSTKTHPSKAASSTRGGKGKRKAAPQDGDDKENNGTALLRPAKRKRRPLGECAVDAKPSAETASSVNMTQESPPIFAFKQGKTALKARKLRKEKRQNQEETQKRLNELATYFASVDAEQLAYL